MKIKKGNRAIPIAIFEAETSEGAVAKADRVGAGQALAASVASTMQILRTMDRIVEQKYANNPGKLAAWASASTVEKAPSSPPPTPPPTP